MKPGYPCKGTYVCIQVCTVCVFKFMVQEWVYKYVYMCLRVHLCNVPYAIMYMCEYGSWRVHYIHTPQMMLAASVCC